MFKSFKLGCPELLLNTIEIVKNPTPQKLMYDINSELLYAVNLEKYYASLPMMIVIDDE